MKKGLFLSLVLSACSPESELVECGSETNVNHFVVTTLGYMRSVEGVSQGFV